MKTPTTQTICFTVFEATRNICFRVLTFEGIKQLLARFHREVLVQHPYISAAALLLWSFYPQFPFHVIYFVLYVVPRSIILGFLTCLGFERQGVRSDSIASRYQSRYYGGYTPSTSFFARSQSYGAVSDELSTARPHSHSVVNIFWRFLGWLILYASLVVLLKYGGK